MSNYTRVWNVATNWSKVGHIKKAISRLSADMAGIIAAYNTLDDAMAAPTLFNSVPLASFREVDANGDLAGLTGILSTCVLNLTADITLSSADYSPRLNGTVVTTQILAAAANPTDTVLIAVTKVDNDVTITVTPNDGTNNGATPVGLTTAQLVLAINGNTTAAYDGINCTITDASSILPLFTASGGDATALADSGEGDGVAAAFNGGQSSNGGILSGVSTPIYQSLSPASDGDNSDRILWAASNNDPIAVSVPLSQELDTSEDLVLHFRIVSGGTTDAVGFSVESFFNEGDTKVTDTTGTNQTTTWAEVTATIAAADIPTGAQKLTINLVPVAHTTDTMALSSFWYEGVRTR